MIRIQQLKLPVTHTGGTGTENKKTLKIGKHDLRKLSSYAAQLMPEKSELKYVYQLDVKVKDENAVLRKAKK